MSATAATTRAAPVSSQWRVDNLRTLSNGLQQCQPPDTISAISAGPRAMSHKPKAVLIVDDGEGMRDTLTAILKREYRVLRVATGEAAPPGLNREDIDLVLLDVRPPAISGYEVLRIVKENDRLVEVIIISAITEIETAVQAIKHGAYHYIAKDFDYDQLRSLVRNASDRQDLNRQVLARSAQLADQTEREF